jgi:DNA polymerase elongation subunit (family B)
MHLRISPYLVFSFTFGLIYNNLKFKEIGLDTSDIVYNECVDEIDLLNKFLKFWRKNFPDLISGWNTSTFDIPYIINRTGVKSVFKKKIIND